MIVHSLITLVSNKDFVTRFNFLPEQMPTRQMYEMGEQIGSGTFGTVWKARHTQWEPKDRPRLYWTSSGREQQNPRAV